MVFLGVAPQSFSTPSWQIEKQYSTRVLTGNWLEERGKVRREGGTPLVHLSCGHQPPHARIPTSPTYLILAHQCLHGQSVQVCSKPCHLDALSLAAPPTNYGLYERLKQQWMLPKTGWRESVYTSSYPRPPLSTMSRWEHAIPVPPPRLKPHF
uniref:Uncharacterized protein n=1 Tax=Urocitellus parryii TaxID=9999 RepID=A0A8D2GXY0_UROPR